MVCAGKALSLVWETGDKRGRLYRLDPHTGQTLDSLDLVGDAGRLRGEAAIGIATEGDNLWVATLYRLIRIRPWRIGLKVSWSHSRTASSD